MMEFNFDKKSIQGKFLIEIDTVAKYGYFEDQYWRGSGLYFEVQEGGEELNLIDYEGICKLPPEVKTGLRQMGIILKGDFN